MNHPLMSQIVEAKSRYDYKTPNRVVIGELVECQRITGGNNNRRREEGLGVVTRHKNGLYDHTVIVITDSINLCTDEAKKIAAGYFREPTTRVTEDSRNLLGQVVTADVKYGIGRPRKVVGVLTRLALGNGFNGYGVTICGGRHIAVIAESIEQGNTLNEDKTS